MSRFVILLLLFMLPVSGFSQRFHGGILAGVGASQISGDNLSGFKKAGLCAGGFVNAGLTPKSFLQLELYYIMKGSHKNPNPKNNDYTLYKLNLQYIEMPILYQWRFSKRFYLELGPALGVLIKNANVEKDESGPLPNQPLFSRFDVSVVGGLGINISTHFKVNFRGENSVIPVRKHFGGITYRLNKGQYNSVLTLSLIYEI